MSEIITISNKGQITIPAQFRKELEFQYGDQVYCDVKDGAFICKKPADFFSLRGCLGKVEIPEDEEELFTDAVADHVMGKA
jgi:AbrB family looped-hinge helix DNA binding protein